MQFGILDLERPNLCINISQFLAEKRQHALPVLGVRCSGHEGFVDFFRGLGLERLDEGFFGFEHRDLILHAVFFEFQRVQFILQFIFSGFLNFCRVFGFDFDIHDLDGNCAFARDAHGFIHQIGREGAEDEGVGA